MKIKTRAFGDIDIDDERVVTFVDPMPGFEEAKKFALLDINPDSPFKLLQLADNSDVCFLVTDPKLFFPNYKVDLGSLQVDDIGLADESSAAVMTIVAIKEGGKMFTTNLYAPIVINTNNFFGKQILLRGSSYKVDEPLPME